MNTDWQNQNTFRRFPLDAADPTAAHRVPEGLIAELQQVNQSLRNSVSALVEIAVTPTQYTLKFQFIGELAVPTEEDPYAHAVQTYAHRIYVPANAKAGDVYSHRDQLGLTRLTVGDGIEELAEWATGKYTVNDQVDPRAQQIYGHLMLNSLTGQMDSEPVDGDIYFHAGHNMRIRMANGRILFDAIPGAGAGFPCHRPIADEDDVDCATLLQYINGAAGGLDGVFDLVDGKGIKIIAQPANHTIIIEVESPENRINC